MSPMIFDDEGRPKGFACRPSGNVVSRCRSCNAEIIFLKTPKGKVMPVDANETATAFAKDGSTYESGNPDLVSHFQTCDDPKRFSRKA